MARDSSILDMVLVPLCLLLLAAYHAHLWFKLKSQPESTVIGVNRLNRQAWVFNTMSTALSSSTWTAIAELFKNVGEANLSTYAKGDSHE